MSKSGRSIETELVHAGEENRVDGAVSMPVFQSAMYEHKEAGDYFGVRYIRLHNTPNHHVLHRKLAALEGAESALVLSSGMAAITTALLSVLRAGDHLLVQNSLYGGTHDFLTRDFPELGLESTFIDAERPESWAALLQKNTRAIYVESLTNPLLQLADLEAVAAFAKAQGLIALIDNTFTGPYNYRPVETGFDLVLHSCTKSLNGHSDIVAGAIVGKAELVERCLHKAGHLGGSLDPHACFLLTRGIKTLALRMQRQNETTEALTRFLAGHPAVANVNYPRLDSHPGHARAAKLFGGCGGVFSFELKSGETGAKKFMRNVRIPIIAPSLGGVETLVTMPVMTSHAGMTPEARREAGISDALIRVSVGIEASADLLRDLEQALEA